MPDQGEESLLLQHTPAALQRNPFTQAVIYDNTLVAFKNAEKVFEDQDTCRPVPHVSSRLSNGMASSFSR